MINRPRGTRDIFFPKTLIYQKINSVCAEVLRTNNYQQIILPSYEHEEVFTSSLGKGSDIVSKEMFTFEDRKGRKLVLRPEGTASVVRAVQQNNLIHSDNKPLKLYYSANMFRYERPQEGRYREFWQFGVELVNAKGFYADCEIIYIVSTIFQNLNIHNFHISINYLGSIENRENYKHLLRNSIKDRIGELCLNCKERYDSNPLRIIDCENCNSLEDIPDYSNSLKGEDEDYFQSLIKQLSILEIPYTVNRKLIRGLDYYTGLVFEVKLDSKDKSVAGGGRYDNLFNSIGKRTVPAIGFAIGIDRLVDFIESSEIQETKSEGRPDVLFLPLCEEAISFSLVTRKKLSKSIVGLTTEVVFDVDNRAKAFKKINYYNPKIVIFVGEKELEERIFSVKNTFSKKEFTVSQDDLANAIKKEITNLWT